MECNKEEALRAKGIAETKMQCRDFVAARKMVLKAQQLFPDLENISQMLTVCQVHCSAEAKVNGSDDWYGILQVEPTADESLIRKQYRKLALLLHPDKNKFAGAEAAFKLVGEAHRTLSDQTKRSVYDLKRSATIKTGGMKPQPHHVNRTSPRRQPVFPNNRTNHAAPPFANLNQSCFPQQQSQAANASQTFWTICSSCGIRYQYYRTILNKALRCQNCLKPFIAHDINAQGGPPGMNPGNPLNQSGIPQHNYSQGQGANNASQQSNGVAGSSGMNSQKNAEAVTRVFVRQGFGNKMEDHSGADNEPGKENEVKVEKVRFEKANKREPGMQASGNSGHKRRRKAAVESSDADSTDSDVIFEEFEHAASWNAEATGSRYPRRSTRQKQNVLYDEDNSDADDCQNPASSKRLRKDGRSHREDQSDKAPCEDDVNEVKVPMYADPVSKNKSEGRKKGIDTEEHTPKGNKQKNCTKQSEDFKGEDVTEGITKDGVSPKSGSDANKQDSVTLSYPDTEFHDFELDKDLKCFAIDQIWAIYDNLDGMPRFYARIRSVSSAGFKVRFTWLEYDPVHQAEMDWYDEELPLGCGNFRLGKTENSEDIRMFSHLMFWGKGSKRNSYVIYPRKGEVWAIFKGWDIKWRLDPDNHRQYEYEIVEVLSDFVADTGVIVASLVKVKEFVSLFCRRGGEGVGMFNIPYSELLRFSHMVPSYRMTGKERRGVPEGLYELDTASLPDNLEKKFPSLSLEEIGVAVEDKCHANGVPCFIPATRDRRSADGQCSFVNGIEKNEKIKVEKPLENSEERSGEPIGDKFAATDAKNIVGGRMPFECPTSNKEDAPCTSFNNAMGNGDSSMPDSSRPLCYIYPDSEFYNFDLERSKERFKTGQIWALYCEDDGFPKYYALVRKVDSGDFKAHIRWLEACPLLEEEIKWSNSDLPFSCGRFRLCSGRGSKQAYDTLETFSHLVHAGYVEKTCQYDIYPQVTEVWALYRNWSAGWALSNLVNCSDRGEYEVVQVLCTSASVITVGVLEKVDGFKAVFRSQRTFGVSNTMEIPRSEFLRFSHRIPSFRLTEEKGGKLRGYWELDPGSLPNILLRTSSD
uniref:DnaJ subfamily B member 14 n=1 Tax=Anthurium amnicola TaxID=1678845 RepID=A0A1D1ZFM9_9ARAE